MIQCELNASKDRVPEQVTSTLRLLQGSSPGADGNIHFIIGKDSDDNDLKSQINDIIYNNTQQVNGSISAEHGIGLDKKKYLIKSRSEDEIELMRLLKNQ